MPPPPRSVRIHHCTSEPYRFFGRAAELALLDRALAGEPPSVVALVGPGGQGKTAIMQHWLERLLARPDRPDGLFLWSFYRGKDADLCLREMLAYAEGLDQPPEVAASFAVDRLLAVLRRERWAVVLDGTEVAQYDSGPWQGRFVHPELGRLLEELAAEPLPGVVVLTTRFELPTLATRRHARLIALSSLDPESARGLLGSLGVQGDDADLDEVAAAGGHHAKAVELLGTFLVRYHGGDARRHVALPAIPDIAGASEEELRVARVLAAYQQALPADMQDVIALATAFRDPPTEARLLEYLISGPVRSLLHTTWGRQYPPFAGRPVGERQALVDETVRLRLLERVGRAGPGDASAVPVLDAHPLVRRAFEHVLGQAGQRQTAQARAGFLRGRPDRKKPATLEEAREEVEMFHAYCEAGLWNEADGALVALDNPKHRFLAPALERDLLLRFFPGGDWRQPPLWSGFGRYRSLAICCELLGQFEEALSIYRESDAALRGDALLALGRIEPLCKQPHAQHPWQVLWAAYRSHALCLAGRMEEAAALARSLVPVDVYEWVHVFECLLRAGQLAALDLKSVLFRPSSGDDHRWADLARRRMRADYLRCLAAVDSSLDLNREYAELIDAYDRGGLPYERALTRLSYTRQLIDQGRWAEAESVNGATLELAQQYGMDIVAADSWALAGLLAQRRGDQRFLERSTESERALRAQTGYGGHVRR
ncbi:MAG: ATP-binding protein [Planctomycetia bacterium]|nr:ATP-binding protein [Planctomycetia bacterium]